MSKAPSTDLPKTVDPYRLAEQNTVLEGEIPLKALSRFREAIQEIDDDARCQVTLTFGMDEERRRMVSGELKTSVVLECQRCIGPMAYTLESQFTLGLVTSDQQAQQLPRELEPFLTEDFSADLWSMVEDELLLALPPFPLHDRDECPADEVLGEFEADEQAEEAKPASRENPFSVLADLKTKKH